MAAPPHIGMLMHMALSDVVKHITVSKALTVALLAASAGVHFGRLSYIDVPEEYAWLVLGAFIATAVLVGIWILQGAWELIKFTWDFVWNWIIYNPLFIRLSPLEIGLLSVLRHHDIPYLNLYEVNTAEAETSRLDLFNTAELLRRKGLVRKDKVSPEFLELTPKGRKYVLKHKSINNPISRKPSRI